MGGDQLCNLDDFQVVETQMMAGGRAELSIGRLTWPGFDPGKAGGRTVALGQEQLVHSLLRKGDRAFCTGHLKRQVHRSVRSGSVGLDAAEVCGRRDARTRQASAAHGRYTCDDVKDETIFRHYSEDNGQMKFRFAASLGMSLSSVRSDTPRRSRWFSISSSLRRAS